jgi:8-oxo-dGTP pyrophosphatase MutT (NUDIX family)
LSTKSTFLAADHFPMRTRLHADLLGFVRAACTHASQAGTDLPVLPFYVREQAVGWIRPSFADLLRRWPHVFEVGSAYVTLRAKPDTPAGRSEAMAGVARELAKDGVIRGWRDELVSVAAHYADPELLRIERAATRHFGLVAYAVHANGFTRKGGLVHVWVARRSAAKSIDPGRLDNLVGGRIAAGMGVDETLRKEAWEEAGIPPSLLKDVNCLGAVRTEYSVPEGLHREVMFVHDLWLPEDFKPVNQDGEVAEILLMPVEEVMLNILNGEFTLDAGTVMIDGLLRLGAVPPEDRQYLELLRLMKP